MQEQNGIWLHADSQRVQVALCLCPPVRCAGCLISDDTQTHSSQCAYQCLVWQALKKDEQTID